MSSAGEVCFCAEDEWSPAITIAKLVYTIELMLDTHTFSSGSLQYDGEMPFDTNRHALLTAGSGLPDPLMLLVHSYLQ